VIHFIRQVVHHPAPGVALVGVSAAALFVWEYLRTSAREISVQRRTLLVRIAVVATALSVVVMVSRFAVG